MKNAFTLIELLAVIIILGVIALIAIPSVNKAIKNGKDELYKVQINNIELGAKSWAAENAFDLPEEDGQMITLTLGQLKMAGFVELDIKNPVSNKFFPNDMEVTITRHMNNYLYEVLEDTGTSSGGEDNLDINMPTIILNGSASDYVDFGETYEDPGVVARNIAGVNITDQVVTEIKSNNEVVPIVDTTRFGQYKIVYTVEDSGNSVSVIRTVTITDTIPPELTIPDDITIYNTEVDTFDVMAGVSATDNSGESVDITTSGSLSSIPGTYRIIYTAKDIKDNVIKKERIITVEEEIIYTDYNEAKGVNAPKLATGMTPVKWDGSSWVTVVDPSNDTSWYDYSNKQWANAKTDDGSMWVWIPRYAYQIATNYHTSTDGTINIKFLIDNTDNTIDESLIESTPSYSGTSQTNYVTHPAFTFGSNEVTGIWVAKFEPSVANQSDACYLTPSATDCNKTTLTPKIIPNARSWTYITVSNAFDVSLAMKSNPAYGWNSSEIDTHLAKNTEWGAVTYLAKSSYGKGDEIWINPANDYTTGCAGDTKDSYATVGCTNDYSSVNGQNASTTGNVYGVYDMSGGSMERVSAYLDNGHPNLSNYGGSLLTADAKYKNVYAVAVTDARADNYENNSNVFGDVMYETSANGNGNASWYGDYSYMTYDSNALFVRGGDLNGANFAGPFYFYGTPGVPYDGYTFRPIVLVGSGL